MHSTLTQGLDFTDFLEFADEGEASGYISVYILPNDTEDCTCYFAYLFMSACIFASFFVCCKRVKQAEPVVIQAEPVKVTNI